MAHLALVSTPIGNLGDLTHRAVEVLRAAEVILAEDTRRTAVLLRHYEIEGRLVSAHQHNEAARAEAVVGWLGEGKAVALVSDAGTPLLSDPGSRIVERVLDSGFEVVPIPGPSAPLAALVASGLPTDRFTFFGFAPRKRTERTRLLEEIASLPHTAVLFESPNRLVRLLHDLAGHAGDGRRVVVARELTKLYEEFVRGTLAEVIARFEAEPPRGEIVVVVAGVGEGERAETAEAVGEAARLLAESLLGQGLAPSAVARELRERLGLPRNAAYQLAQEVAGGREGE